MYPYHNVIKKRIKNGELIGIEKTSGEFALILHFSTPPFKRPIRQRSLYKYKELLKNIPTKFK